MLSLQRVLGNRAVTGIVGAVGQRMLDQEALLRTRVMLLDMKGQPIARGTIDGAPAAGKVLVLSKWKRKLRGLANLRTLSATEAAADDGTDVLPTTASNYTDEAREPLALWRLPATDRTGSLLDAPNRRLVQLAEQAHGAFTAPPETRDRTVYLRDGSFADAERLFGQLLGKFSVEGSSELANRRASTAASTSSRGRRRRGRRSRSGSRPGTRTRRRRRGRRS